MAEKIYRAMTLSERKKIQKLLEEGKSFCYIGGVLGRSHTSISNEVKRVGGDPRFYEAEKAQEIVGNSRKAASKTAFKAKMEKKNAKNK